MAAKRIRGNKAKLNFPPHPSPPQAKKQCVVYETQLMGLGYNPDIKSYSNEFAFGQEIINLDPFLGLDEFELNQSMDDLWASIN